MKIASTPKKIKITLEPQNTIGRSKMIKLPLKPQKRTQNLKKTPKDSCNLQNYQKYYESRQKDQNTPLKHQNDQNSPEILKYPKNH